MPKALDPRWVVLAETGEYSTMGRYREPDTEDIHSAEQALIRAGRAGWIAIMSNSVHCRTKPELLMVKPLCNPAITFEEAVRALHERT